MYSKPSADPNVEFETGLPYWSSVTKLVMIGVLLKSVISLRSPEFGKTLAMSLLTPSVTVKVGGEAAGVWDSIPTGRPRRHDPKTQRWTRSRGSRFRCDVSLPRYVWTNFCHANWMVIFSPNRNPHGRACINECRHASEAGYSSIRLICRIKFRSRCPSHSDFGCTTSSITDYSEHWELKPPRDGNRNLHSRIFSVWSIHRRIRVGFSLDVLWSPG